jgi:hypothetical protein
MVLAHFIADRRHLVAKRRQWQLRRHMAPRRADPPQQRASVRCTMLHAQNFIDNKTGNPQLYR